MSENKKMNKEMLAVKFCEPGYVAVRECDGIIKEFKIYCKSGGYNYSGKAIAILKEKIETEATGIELEIMVREAARGCSLKIGNYIRMIIAEYMEEK